MTNLHQRTKKQHVFPKSRLAPFLSKNNNIYSVYFREGNKWRKIPSLKNKLFVVDELWDQHTEHGWANQTETKFSKLAQKCSNGIEPDDAEKGLITRFFSLWAARCEVRNSPQEGGFGKFGPGHAVAIASDLWEKTPEEERL